MWDVCVGSHERASRQPTSSLLFGFRLEYCLLQPLASLVFVVDSQLGYGHECALHPPFGHLFILTVYFSIMFRHNIFFHIIFENYKQKSCRQFLQLLKIFKIRKVTREQS